MAKDVKTWLQDTKAAQRRQDAAIDRRMQQRVKAQAKQTDNKKK